jgi:hypothetical protein
MVAFAAPGNMVAKPASVGCFALFPLDRDIFIESGHSQLPPEMHSIPGMRGIKRKRQSAASKIVSNRIKIFSGRSQTQLIDSNPILFWTHRARLQNPLGQGCNIRVIWLPETAK